METVIGGSATVHSDTTMIRRCSFHLQVILSRYELWESNSPRDITTMLDNLKLLYCGWFFLIYDSRHGN